MAAKRNKRLLAQLHKALRKYGATCSLAEAIAHEQAVTARKRGKPQKWDSFLARLIFVQVEFVKSEYGVTTTKAWELVQKFHKLSVNQEKQYVEGRRLAPPVWEIDTYVTSRFKQFLEAKRRIRGVSALIPPCGG
jgi:hypothetical protein